MVTEGGDAGKIPQQPEDSGVARTSDAKLEHGRASVAARPGGIERAEEQIEPLVDHVSAESAPAVEEFMAEAALANEAEGTAVSEEMHFAGTAGLEGASFAQPPVGPYIAFQHVSKSFGDFVVLQDVSFYVNPGETLCILGRSGVGKSVSLQIIMGFLKPDNGTVLVAGQEIAGFSEREMQEVRRKVTMVFQNGALFDSITVGENVAFPLRERGDMQEDQMLQVVKGLLEMVGVAGMENQLPSDLSTGMKRSVAIARALAAQPSAVLYDEPTTMVDPLMGNLLGDLIQRLKMQLHLTSIVVSHDMRFAEKLADRVVFLHEGKARFFGTMDEMRASDDPVLCEFLSLDELVVPTNPDERPTSVATLTPSVR
jgi:phospholipid/cholesterol/gamma-HCH transport system ATP-binding protein